MGTFAQWVKQQEDRQDGIGYFARYWASVTPGKISSVDGVKKQLDKIDKTYADSRDERGKAAIAAALSGYGLAVGEYHKLQAAERATALGLDVRVPDEPPPGYDAPVSKPEDVLPYPQPEDAAMSPGEAQRLAEAMQQTREAARDIAPPERYELAADEHGPRIARRDPVSGEDSAVEALRDLERAAAAAREEALEPTADSVVLHTDHGAFVTNMRKPEPPASRLAAIETRLGVIERRLELVLDALYPEPTDWDELYRMASHGDGE